MDRWISQEVDWAEVGRVKIMGLEEITHYFLHRHNSGFVEGLNNKIKVLKRRCYGLFNLSHLFQRLFLDLEGYRLFVATTVG